MAAWPRASGVSVGRSKPNFESVFGQCSVWSRVTAKVETEQNVAGLGSWLRVFAKKHRGTMIGSEQEV